METQKERIDKQMETSKDRIDTQKERKDKQMET